MNTSKCRILTSNMTTIVFLAVTAIIVDSFGQSASAAETAAGNDSHRDRPNIVLFVLEQAGIADLSCYGGPIPTPNIDALAQTGVRFTRFTSTSVDYYTGNENFSGQSAWTILFDGHPKQTDVPAQFIVPHVLLGDAGYHVHHGSGSWGDGYVVEQLGIDLKERGKNFSREKVFQVVQEWEGKQPLLLSWGTARPGKGLYEREDYVAKMKGRFDDGPAKIAAEIYRRQVEMGLYPDDAGWVNPLPGMLAETGGKHPKAALAVYPRELGEISSWTARQYMNWDNTDMSLTMEVYAAMVARTDEDFGRLVALLKEKGEYENTLFIVCSNSGSMGHHRSQGSLWATVGATPFVGEARKPEAGGRIAPLIVSWPAKMKADRKGSIEDTLVNSLDLAPTLLAAGGVTYPKTNDEDEQLAPLRGRSLLSALSSDLPPDDKPFITAERQAWRGVFSDRWSAWGPLGKGGQPDSANHWQLYDLEKDPFERTNIAAEHPEVVQQKLKEYEAWASTVPVLLPRDWAAYGKNWKQAVKQKDSKQSGESSKPALSAYQQFLKQQAEKKAKADK